MEDEYLTSEQISDIKRKAFSLREAAVALEEDVNSSSFDINDARSCFEEVSEEFVELKKLLSDGYDEYIVWLIKEILTDIEKNDASVTPHAKGTTCVVKPELIGRLKVWLKNYEMATTC